MGHRPLRTYIFCCSVTPCFQCGLCTVFNALVLFEATRAVTALLHIAGAFGAGSIVPKKASVPNPNRKGTDWRRSGAFSATWTSTGLVRVSPGLNLTFPDTFCLQGITHTLTSGLSARHVQTTNVSSAAPVLPNRRIYGDIFVVLHHRLCQRDL